MVDQQGQMNDQQGQVDGLMVQENIQIGMVRTFFVNAPDLPRSFVGAKKPSQLSNQ